MKIETRAPLRATYRVQLTPTFGFNQAAQILPYLSSLGISQLYFSPYLQAAPGSTHGYDVVNYHCVSHELGGEDELTILNQALRSHGMGQVFDMVPNHMAITGPENPWWWDVLENGPSSRYAAYFDVEWDPPEARHSNVVLVPVLGDQYGVALEAGQIQVEFDGQAFTVRYYDHTYPVDPRSVGLILASAAEAMQNSPAGDRLAFLAGAFSRLPGASAADRDQARRRSQDTAVLYDLLARECRDVPALKAAVQSAVSRLNQDPDALDIFLELQNYRLAFWRISKVELGYRRFFDINTMAGLRMEDELVYLDSHSRVLEWLRAGELDGLRIDHPDGLRDPPEYLRRLRSDAPSAWIVVEKILESKPSEGVNEHLPDDWPVNGTTGYDFLNLVNGLFIDPDSEAAFTQLYQDFSGLDTPYPLLAYHKKLLAAREVLGSDLERLSALFLMICESHRRYRDYPYSNLRAALAETAACLPVYRTYARPSEGQISAQDEAYILRAINEVKVLREDLDPRLLDFLRDLLTLKVRGEVETEFVQRFQQFSGPVMAKGIEDTAFYVYNRFVSLNEVGGDPARFGVTVDEFHKANAYRLEHWPYAMLSTSTHDTKRAEDARARLNALSEMPERWAEAVQRWSENNARYRSGREGWFEDPNAEYLLYQTMVGAWPLELERALQYMEKAEREAKVNTSWRNPNPDYERALGGFIRAVYADTRFIRDLDSFADTVVPVGRVNSLSQTLLKLTAPGVPDIYQGTELWDTSLVDPDNRRPVDYDTRRALLADLAQGLKPEEILERMDEGLPKLWVIRQALDLRSRRGEWFDQRGSYTPIPVPEDAGVAFLRGAGALVIVPRLSLKFSEQGVLTFALPAGHWHSVLTGEDFFGGPTPLGILLARFPVGLFERVGETV